MKGRLKGGGMNWRSNWTFNPDLMFVVSFKRDEEEEEGKATKSAKKTVNKKNNSNNLITRKSNIFILN